MWPRVVEVFLGVWLAASPFVFDVTRPAAFWSALGGGVLIAASSAAAWGEWYPSARFLTLAAAVGIAAGVYIVATHPATGFQQSAFLTAILVGMFAIIPNRSNRPPREWVP